MIRNKIVSSLGSLLVGMLVGLALISLPVFADWKKWKGDQFFLEAPPTAGSAEVIEDFKQLHGYERTRKVEQCELAKDQRDSSFKNFFKHKDELLTQEEYDRLKPLMKEVGKMVDRVAEHFKAEFLRTRPYIADPTLKPCVEPVASGSKSYPSAHATMGAVFACTLSYKFPSREDALAEYGRFVGELRAVVGLHHPSDIKAGQRLAQRICKHLLADQDFLRELSIH